MTSKGHRESQVALMLHCLRGCLRAMGPTLKKLWHVSFKAARPSKQEDLSLYFQNLLHHNHLHPGGLGALQHQRVLLRLRYPVTSDLVHLDTPAIPTRWDNARLWRF